MNKLYKIIFNIARTFAVPGFNFLTAIVGVKFLGESNWGDFVQLLLWVYLVVFIANFGNKDFLLRAYSKMPSNINKIFLVNLLARSVLVPLSFLLLLFFPLKIAIIGILLCILIFIYQSLESLVLYHQKFMSQLIAEIVGFVLIIIPLLFFDSLKTQDLLLIYCFSFTSKILILFPNLKIEIVNTRLSFSFNQITLMFPFFLIGLSGWLSSKIDLYLVNIYLPSEELAKYQLLTTAFLMIRSLPALIIYPFSKHLYRLPKKTIIKIKNNLGVVALPIVIICSISTFLIFEYFAGIALSKWVYIVGALSCIPIYFFMIDLLLFYKNKMEKKVAIINFSTTLINLALSTILILKIGILGAVIAVAIIQFAILYLYKHFLNQ